MRLLIIFLLLASALSPSASACELCLGDGCPECLAPPAFAIDALAVEAPATYQLQGGRWPQPGGRGSPVTLTYSYNNLLDGGLKDPRGVPLSTDYLRAAVEEALGLWASVAPLHFVEVEDVGTRVYTGFYQPGDFGQIRLSHRYINGPDPPVGNPTTKALAYYPSAGGALAGDIHLDNSDPWSPQGTLSTPDVLGAVVHELGHTLGLGHDTSPDANMYWIFTRTQGLGTATLHPSDIAGIRAVYGAGVGSVTPLVRVPEPSSLGLVIALALGVLPHTTPRRKNGRTGCELSG